LVGYFSYDIIRYIEKIPDKCLDDLKIPDIRLMRPKTIIIHDNLLKKIYIILLLLITSNIGLALIRKISWFCLISFIFL